MPRTSPPRILPDIYTSILDNKDQIRKTEQILLNIMTHCIQYRCESLHKQNRTAVFMSFPMKMLTQFNFDLNVLHCNECVIKVYVVTWKDVLCKITAK